jgi:hypothetical protein
MAYLIIEIDRGAGWQIRSEGEFVGTADEIKAKLPAYAIQYPHRARLDDVIVAEARP